MSETLLLGTKILAQLALPEGLLVALAGASAVAAGLRFRRCAWLMGTLGLCLYLLFATPVFANWLARSLETQHHHLGRQVVTMDVAIILGGSLAPAIPPRTSIGLTNGSDRIWQGVRLYREGTVRRIIVVGGNVPWSAETTPEALSMRQLMVDWGVPESAIVVAPRSRTTYENALEVAEMQKAAPFGSALLVTSAMHMPRALATFQAAGIMAQPSQADYRATDGVTNTVLGWIPSARAFALTSDAMREWLGYFIYRSRGWL